MCAMSWLPRVASRDAISALALTEPARRLRSPVDLAEWRNDRVRLSSTATSRFNHQRGDSDFYSVLAREGDSSSLVFVAGATAGITSRTRTRSRPARQSAMCCLMASRAADHRLGLAAAGSGSCSRARDVPLSVAPRRWGGWRRERSMRRCSDTTTRVSSVLHSGNSRCISVSRLILDPISRWPGPLTYRAASAGGSLSARHVHLSSIATVAVHAAGGGGSTDLCVSLMGRFRPNPRSNSAALP